MKSLSNEKKSQQVYVPATRAQKIWGVIALAGLFMCGIMIGVSMHSKNQVAGDASVHFTESQCNTIAMRIDGAINMGQYDNLENLKKIYAESCGGHVYAKKEVVSDTTENLTTCQKVEKLLLEQIRPWESQDYNDHEFNARVYYKLISQGCPENSEKYKQLVKQENEIAATLNPYTTQSTNSMRTCDEIEMVLTERISENPYSNNARMQNAEIYSTLAERGCPENKEKYKELALRQIDVVSAVSDKEELINNKDAIIDTYRKLQMQDAARKFLKKMDKLVTPATDFIFELEKVINE